jgi:hypothetical protein
MTEIIFVGCKCHYQFIVRISLQRNRLNAECRVINTLGGKIEGYL